MKERNKPGRLGRWYVTVVSLLVGLGMVVAGGWSLVVPRSFAELVNFPYHEHFLHDLGAFSIGIGVILLFALVWSDALAAALAGFVTGNSIHSVNHAVDLGLGGHAWDALALAVVSLVAAAALGLQLRWLVSHRSPSAAPAREPPQPVIQDQLEGPLWISAGAESGSAGETRLPALSDPT